MAEQFKVNQQVVSKKKMQNNMSLVRVGQILSFADNGEKARVHFPADEKTELLPVSSLETVKKNFRAEHISYVPDEQQIVHRGF